MVTIIAALEGSNPSMTTKIFIKNYENKNVNCRTLPYDDVL
jgi:hypothetical protein